MIDLSIHHITWPIRKFGRFIKKLVIYFPFLWKDEDWDFEGIYDFLEIKLKRLAKDQSEDTLHVGNEKRVRQIKICLAHLDRYRNWPNYIDFPTDDYYFIPTPDGCLRQEHSSSINEAKRKRVSSYEQFHYQMFWKRFLQWYTGWWS